MPGEYEVDIALQVEGDIVIWKQSALVFIVKNDTNLFGQETVDAGCYAIEHNWNSATY